MLFLFNVVAVARKERDALVGHGLVVVLAVLAAVFLAIGIVMRQRATMDVPQEHGVSSVMFLTLLRRPLWWAGTAAAVAGYVFQALALAKGDLVLPGAGSGPDAGRLAGRGTDQFKAFRQHPFVIVNMALSPLLVAEVNRVLQTASGSSWQLVICSF